MGLLYVFLFYLWLIILGLLASLLAKGVKVCEVLDGRCWREGVGGKVLEGRCWREGVIGSFRELLKNFLKVADFEQEERME
jgi:hypothetical protein